jgi:hypothetical protein
VLGSVDRNGFLALYVVLSPILKMRLLKSYRPITTWCGRGAAASGLLKSHCSIIYTGSTVPALTLEEISGRSSTDFKERILAYAIQVVSTKGGKKLSPMSRLCYGEVHKILWYVRARVFGEVHPDSWRALLDQYRHVWRGRQVEAKQELRVERSETAASFHQVEAGQ